MTEDLKNKTNLASPIGELQYVKREVKATEVNTRIRKAVTEFGRVANSDKLKTKQKSEWRINKTKIAVYSSICLSILFKVVKYGKY